MSHLTKMIVLSIKVEHTVRQTVSKRIALSRVVGTTILHSSGRVKNLITRLRVGRKAKVKFPDAFVVVFAIVVPLQRISTVASACTSTLTRTYIIYV